MILEAIGYVAEINRLKVELASKNLRITGLEETLRQTLEQLIKVQNSDPEIRNHDLKTNQVIARARRMLSDEDDAAAIAAMVSIAKRRKPDECEYPNCKCPRVGRCGKAG